MTKRIRVSADEQLDILYDQVAMVGTKDYEYARRLLSDTLEAEHGRNVTFDYDDIPDEDMQEFLSWLACDE